MACDSTRSTCGIGGAGDVGGMESGGVPVAAIVKASALVMYGVELRSMGCHKGLICLMRKSNDRT